MRAFKQSTKSKKPGFPTAAIEHPDGPQWFTDQINVAFKIAKNKLGPPPQPLVPGLTRPLQYDFDLPTSGITDFEGNPIRKIVKTGETSGRYTKDVVDGFPPELNRPVSTPEEINERRKERLMWVNANCLEIATPRGGDRPNDIQLRPKSGVAEQTFGNLDLRITLALRFAAKEGFDLESLYEGSCRYGAKALERFCGVIVVSKFVHPPNPYMFLTGKRHGRGPDLGFNLHLQYQTCRGFGGAWLSEFKEFHQATPGVCAGINLIEMGVDIDAYSRASERAKWEFLIKESKPEYWRKFKLADETVAKIRRCRAAVEAGKTTIETVIDKELEEWSADLAKGKSKNMVGIYRRNLATASRHGQVPPDYLVGALGSRYIRREGEKVVGEKWKMFLERADRCALAIETRHFEKGFTMPLSNHLYEWEAEEEEMGRSRKFEAEKAEQQCEIEAAHDQVGELTELLEREKADRAADERRFEEQRQQFGMLLREAKAGSAQAMELQLKIAKLDSDRASENAVFEERVSALAQRSNEANAALAAARAELTAERSKSADFESKLQSLERDRVASEKRHEDEKAALERSITDTRAEGLVIRNAQFQDLPRLKSIVEMIEARRFGGTSEFPTWAEEYIDPECRLKGCPSMSKKFIDEFQAVKALVPKLAEDIERRVQAIAARAEIHNFHGAIEAVEKLLHQRALPASDRVWFTSYGGLRFDLLADAYVALREAEGPFRNIPDVQHRAAAAKTLIELVNQHGLQPRLDGINGPRTPDERAEIDAQTTAQPDTEKRSRVG